MKNLLLVSVCLMALFAENARADTWRKTTFTLVGMTFDVLTEHSATAFEAPVKVTQREDFNDCVLELANGNEYCPWYYASANPAKDQLLVSGASLLELFRDKIITYGSSVDEDGYSTAVAILNDLIYQAKNSDHDYSFAIDVAQSGLIGPDGFVTALTINDPYMTTRYLTLSVKDVSVNQISVPH